MIWCGGDNYILWRQKKSFAAHACVIVVSQKHGRQKFEISKPANLWHRGRLRPAALFSLRQNCDCFVYNYVWTCHVRKTFIKALGPGYLAKLTGKAKKEHLFYQHQGRGLCKYWLLQIQKYYIYDIFQLFIIILLAHWHQSQTLNASWPCTPRLPSCQTVTAVHLFFFNWSVSLH